MIQASMENVECPADDKRVGTAGHHLREQKVIDFPELSYHFLCFFMPLPKSNTKLIWTMEEKHASKIH